MQNTVIYCIQYSYVQIEIDSTNIEARIKPKLKFSIVQSINIVTTSYTMYLLILCICVQTFCIHNQSMYACVSISK